MSRVGTATVIAVGAGGVVAVRAARRAAAADGGAGRAGGTRWQAVTVYADPDEVAPGGRLPEPLAALGERVETRISPAPGGRGTEVAARLRRPAPTGLAGALARVLDEDPRQDLRSALRRAKQLVEVGEVLVVDPVPHGERSAIGTAVIGTATRRAGREGVL
ncbi:hypothetical protein [Quadrisphaera sp. DSM 44207]|uniref:hypothetical protein n=1 Tax=Quadrisphaera sp. DSM 44207 TaxID=1881057 RepID=UPI00088682C4|nr:hypothetical protein [Quadrisphaera sp. DSM 44207]SDQ06966.1 hypothetical protein SAMN05428996_0337 [Quadrisphaera sp. DSM 44207]